MLHNNGQIKYYDMDMTQKGSIQLDRHCYCVSKDKSFELVTVSRTYYLYSDLAGYCAKWVADIEQVITTL